jgi:hypothetical protein
VFFGALTGFGYVDPDAAGEYNGVGEFIPGQPVFDRAGAGIMNDQRVEEMRRLEEEWAKKKRPKDVSRPFYRSRD